MSALGIVTTIIEYAGYVHDAVKQVKGFKKCSENLAQRVEVVTVPVRMLENKLNLKLASVPSDADDKQLSDIRPLTELADCFKKVGLFLQKLSTMNSVRKLINKGDITAQFDGFDKQLTNSQLTLILTLQVVLQEASIIQLRKHMFDERTMREENQEALAQDQKDLESGAGDVHDGGAGVSPIGARDVGDGATVKRDGDQEPEAGINTSGHTVVEPANQQSVQNGPRDEYFDIFLMQSGSSQHTMKIQEICRNNSWKVQTYGEDTKLGAKIFQAIEEILSTSTHLIVFLTAEDCKQYKEHDHEMSMSVEMAFQLAQQSGKLDTKVIPIRCCEKRVLPLCLQALTGSHIMDVDLEKQLKKTIKMEVRQSREADSQSKYGK